MHCELTFAASDEFHTSEPSVFPDAAPVAEGRAAGAITGPTRTPP